VTHILDLNAKDQWLQNGIFSHVGEFGDESGEKKAQSQRILELLTGYQGQGLTANEICNALPDIPKKSLYRACDRLEDRQMITKRRSKTDGKTWVYAIPTDDRQTAIAISSEPEQTPEPEKLPIGSQVQDAKTKFWGKVTGLTDDGYLADMETGSKSLIPFDKAIAFEIKS
jgi:hypothetical protein